MKVRELERWVRGWTRGSGHRLVRKVAILFNEKYRPSLFHCENCDLLIHVVHGYKFSPKNFRDAVIEEGALRPCSDVQIEQMTIRIHSPRTVDEQIASIGDELREMSKRYTGL